MNTETFRAHNVSLLHLFTKNSERPYKVMVWPSGAFPVSGAGDRTTNHVISAEPQPPSYEVGEVWQEVSMVSLVTLHVNAGLPVSSPHPAEWSEVLSGWFEQSPPSASPHRWASDLAPPPPCHTLLRHSAITFIVPSSSFSFCVQIDWQQV